MSTRRSFIINLFACQSKLYVQKHSVIVTISQHFFTEKQTSVVLLEAALCFDPH